MNTRWEVGQVSPPETPTAHFADTVQNEAFCMQLAARMGLPIPPATILHHQEIPLYLMTRYDRELGAERSAAAIKPRSLRNTAPQRHSR